jgi:hypothetical protein
MTDQNSTTEAISSSTWAESLRARGLVVTTQQPVLMVEGTPAIPSQPGTGTGMFGTHIREAARILRGR